MMGGRDKMQQALSAQRVVALGAALVMSASACDSGHAVAPVPPEAAAEALDPSLAAEFGQGLNVAMADAIDRLAPALGDDVGRVLGGHLRHLATALGAGNVPRARDALRGSYEALGGVAATPDAGAIGLVLDHTEALLSVR